MLENNTSLANTAISKSIWWRLTWRQTLFFVVTMLVLYALDGFHMFSLYSGHNKFIGISELIMAFAFDGSIAVVLFAAYSVYILRSAVWRKPIKDDAQQWQVHFIGTKRTVSLTTIEAALVFFAILWRAWILNGVLLSLLWWIPGFFIVSYLVAKFIAILWYIRYPLGKIKLAASLTGSSMS
ncbi:MAG: hypothetical protein PHO57_06875 [Acidithiobacillus sp.]|nr:hypothetical protein [Acidithiobacillus sp.]